jgi:hypothetical protein
MTRRVSYTTLEASGEMPRLWSAKLQGESRLQKRRLCLSLSLALMVIAFLSSPTLANTLTVTNTNDSGLGSLRDAIQSAVSGDTINLGVSGKITLTGGILTVGKNLTITGPGAGSLAIDGNGASGVFYVPPGVTTSISGVTIQNGSANDWGTGIESDGSVSGPGSFYQIEPRLAATAGGIRNEGTLTLSNNTLSGNSGYSCGAISNLGTLTVNNSTVSSNTGLFGIGPAEADAGSDGLPGGSSSYCGGIYNAGTLVVDNSSLSSDRGAEILNAAGTFTVSNSALNGNTLDGSFVYTIANVGGTGTVTGTNVSSNGWTSIFNQSNLTVSNTIVQGGTNYYYVPNVVNFGGTLAMRNSTITRTFGPALANFDSGTTHGVVTIINSTMSGNLGPHDGVILNRGSSIAMSNSTVAGNNVEGWGIYNAGSGSITVKNTILADNGAAAGGWNCVADSVPITSLGYNLSDDDSCVGATSGVTGYSFGNFSQPGDMNNTPAGLDPNSAYPNGPQNNGGPTPTVALLPTSHAIDAIPASACTDVNGNPVTTDQRGVSRPQGPGCDIGAYEQVEAPGTTPAGGNVTVQPQLANGTSPITLTFSNVTQAGVTTITQSGTGTPPPSGFKLISPPTYYDLSTTAVFSGPVTVCVNYSGSGKPQLFHYQNGAWVNVTTTSTTTSPVCGTVTSLSPFAIFESAYTATVQQPISADGSSVFSANRGVVPAKFNLALNGTPTCQLPPATILLIRTSGGTVGAVNESTFSLPSDNGSNFRIDSINCQYVYNIGTSTLAIGTYQVQIIVSGVPVGSAKFGLQ